MNTISIQKITLNEVEALQAISRLTFYETFAEVNTEENMSSYLENDLSLERLSAELIIQIRNFSLLLWKMR